MQPLLEQQIMTLDRHPLPKPINLMLRAYQDVLLDHFPHDLERLILFGSQARGTPHAESDVDVLVVVSWDEPYLGQGFYRAPFDDPRWRTIVNLAVDISLQYGVILSPKIMGRQQFEKWSPLGSQIKAEGIEIWTKNKKLYTLG